MQSAISTTRSYRLGGIGRRARQHCSRVHASKGFGEADSKQPTLPRPEEANSDVPAAAPSTSGAGRNDFVIEAIEARIRSRRQRKRVEPQVKVESATVAQATGQVPATPAGEMETKVVQALGVFFIVIILEGLLLAASGLLPEAADVFVQDVVYPSYSLTVLSFLAASSLYGLFKVGKLPGQKQL